MDDFLTFFLILLFSTIRLATPLLFAALGGLFSERSGVINIALEGLLLAGAFTAAVVTYETSNPYIGFVSAMAAGAFVAADEIVHPPDAGIDRSFRSAERKQRPGRVGIVIAHPADRAGPARRLPVRRPAPSGS